MDIRTQVDAFLSAEKTIVGAPQWNEAQRSGMRRMRRSLLQDGEAVDAFLESQAYLTAQRREFRHLIVFGGRCICRLDYAPEIDGAHFNGMDCPACYPVEKAADLHYHTWEGNRHKATATTLPIRVNCAVNVHIDALDINKAFWWFCDQTNIKAVSADVPDWPPRDSLL